MDTLREWERCSGWIEAALYKSGATHTSEDVRKAVEEGRVQFWPGEGCALVTEVLEYPQSRRVRVWLAGGDLGEIAGMLETGERWARLIGAEAIEVVGRHGWKRVLESDGFEEKAVYLVKEL